MFKNIIGIEAYHVVPTAPDYSVAKAMADELGGFILAE